jgi:stress-induced morphogen
MADAENNINGADALKEEVIGSGSLSAEQILALQDELALTKTNLEKARRGEKFNQSKRIELETQLKEFVGGEDFKTKYEAVSKELGEVKSVQRTQLVDTVLKDELTKAGATAISTVLKLIDRSLITVENGLVDAKSVESVIAELKKTDAVLFELPKVPELKRPGEANVTSSFKTEMAAAKSQKDIQSILKKYGMGSTI